MNHTVTHSAASIYATPITRPEVSPGVENKGSILERVISSLAKMTKDFCVKDKPISQYKSFMDENLLDPVVGPEVSRTLRR
jgi:hypothetical protein